MNNDSDYKPNDTYDNLYVPFKITNNKLNLENFSDYGFENTSVIQKRHVAGDATTYLDISNHQIAPLRHMTKDYIAMLNKAEQNYIDICGNLVDYIEYVREVGGEIDKDINKKIKITSKDSTSLSDAMLKDTDFMIVQQNYIYILGTLTFTILLLGTFVIARN